MTEPVPGYQGEAGERLPCSYLSLDREGRRRCGRRRRPVRSWVMGHGSWVIGRLEPAIAAMY